MRIEIMGLQTGLGATSLIRTMAWILAGMDKEVLVLSDSLKLDQKFCKKPSGAADAYLLDLARGKANTPVLDYATELHSNLRILESSSVLSQREKMEMQKEASIKAEMVLLAEGFTRRPARRFLVLPPNPLWLQQDKKRVDELQVEHFFVSHLSEENCCLEMYKAYDGIFGKPFTLLPSCPLLQREWLEPLNLRNLLNSSYGQAVQGSVENLFFPERVMERNPVYKVLHRFRRKQDER